MRQRPVLASPEHPTDKEHAMDCPVCKNVNLVMSERQGIEIDYCPNCRGVWLDRGELDKIIDRSVGVSPAAAPAPDPRYPQQGGGYQQPHPAQGHYPHRKKKREGFLGELFDFD
jgi:Zn-finger nucleic acid-binding protein